MELTDLEKQRIREICWNAVKNLNVDIKDRQTIKEGLYRAFTNEAGEGSQGPAGKDGKSAYELAVEEGFEGTLEEWLTSIVGPAGPAGDDGINAEITDCTATVDNTSGTPKVVVTMGGTASKRTFKFDFTGLVGPQAAINLTQSMPGKLLIFPDSKNNEYRPVFNMREAANAFYNDAEVLQTRFAQGDCAIDGDGKVWVITSVENEGLNGTGGNEAVIQLSIIPKTIE